MINNTEVRWDPTVIYVGTHIFLPKKVGKNWWSIKNSLTFMSGNNRFKAYKEGPTHIAIPREYITKEDCTEAVLLTPESPRSISCMINP